jgi:YebC/PmpR family DNA-binding regulatory protein
MSGHSKWSQIKRGKAIKDQARGAVFARLSREIMVACKLGGPDPDGNFRLRTAIDKAKVALLPADNIKRAIEKGSGQGATDTMESLTYEGYGPGGVAILIEAMTDNRNRTAGDIRSYFNKYMGNLGADGCVAWLFKQQGEIRVAADTVTDEGLLFEKSIDAGVDDFSKDSDSNDYCLWTSPETMNAVCQALTVANITVGSAEWVRLPQTTVIIDDLPTATILLKLLDAIEAQDDVQALHTNVQFADGLVETS